MRGTTRESRGDETCVAGLWLGRKRIICGMKTHFSAMLLLLCLQWQNDRQQLLSNLIPTTVENSTPASIFRNHQRAMHIR